MHLDSRLKKLLKGILGSSAARLINLLIALALIPLTINALSQNDYAFLSMAISLSLLSTYADLGMGLAIVNILARESHKKIPRRSQRAVSVVWFSLIGFTLILLFITGGLALWVKYFAPAEDSYQYNAMLLGAACVLAGLPTGLVQRILFARQQITEANAWTTSGRLLSLAFVWYVVNNGTASLPLLVFGIIGVPVAISWISVFIVFSRNTMKKLVPRLQYYNRRLLKPYIFMGLSFLVMQLVPYIEVGIDTLLAGSLIGTHVVPSLDVYTRLFTYIPALISIALFPLWPAIAHAKSDGDTYWILKIQRLAYIATIAFSASISFIFTIYSEKLITQWTSQHLSLPPLVLIGIATFAILTCIGTVQSMILNGIGVITQQIKLYAVYLIILLITKSGAALIFGLPGMIWALNICYLFRLLMTTRLLRVSLTTKT